jgi:Fe-S-cluster containining protein
VEEAIRKVIMSMAAHFDVGWAMTDHPCRTCGACCAFFRVSFHWTETCDTSHGVPENLTVNVSPYADAMSGTEKTVSRCIALEGVVGESAGCTIYENRPSPCRSFKASFEDGTENEACGRVRTAKGMAPLTLESWLTPGIASGSYLKQ